MDASHPLMFEGRRVELDPHGPTASKCQVGRASSSQANRRVRDEDWQNGRGRGYGAASVPVALGRYGHGRRQGVMANRSDRDPPSLHGLDGREAQRRMRRGSADSIRAGGHKAPHRQAGYKAAICLPVTPKSVLASREASIQRPIAEG